MKKNPCILIILFALILPLLMAILAPHPAIAADITLDRNSASVGSKVVVTGTDFTGQTATIHFDGKELVSDIPISSTGNFSHTITIPSAANGEHVIKVTDSSNWSGSTGTITINVVPGISIFPDSGRVLSKINIVGTGFPKYETDIKVIWDGADLSMSSITADQQGRWHYDFEIPNNAEKGWHSLGAYSKTVKAEQIEKMQFIVIPWAKISPTSGPVGTRIVVNAWGFRVGEDGITLTFDDEIMVYNINANDQGAVIDDSDSRIGDTTERPYVIVPPSPLGIHKVGVFGSSFTPKGTYADMDFTVVPSIEIEPGSGKQGSQATIKGYGFAMNDVVTVSFDNAVLKQNATADRTGSFSLVFEIPVSTTTSHTITAVSSKGQSAKTTFTSERTVSREVKLVSPADGNEYILFESAWDVYSSTFKYIFSIFDYISGAKKSIYQSKPVVVDWSDVPLQGVTYVLDVADADNPSVSVISKEIKEKSQYSISGNESLPPGKYTWKVKSRYEGTDSSWSESRDFEIITMPVRVLLFTIAIGILVIAAIVFIVLLIRANLRRY